MSNESVSFAERLAIITPQWEVLYDTMIYQPISRLSLPLVHWLPATIRLSWLTKYPLPFFTANNITYARTTLLVPIVFCLRYSRYPALGSFLVLIHDYLDHLDGVVAKEHARLGLATGSSRYGAFLDAMCDKLVNCVTMFTEILFLEYRGTDEWIVLALVTVVIVQELALAIIRSQQYFSHKHYAIQATLAGKLKEKTESLAIVLLAIHPLYPDYILFPVILMLLLTISLAWQSLKQKIYSLAAVD